METNSKKITEDAINKVLIAIHSNRNYDDIKMSLDRDRLVNYIGRIRSSFLYLDAAEHSRNYNNVPSILEALTYPFSIMNDAIFEYGKIASEDGKHVLWVGALFHSFSGHGEEAIRYYQELANQYRKIDDMENYEKYKMAAEKIII